MQPHLFRPLEAGMPRAHAHEIDPETDLIRKQLERVLASPQFSRSERLSRFLRFAVEAALAGELDRLKETNVGVEVFDRSPSYDPKVEPIVRVEARRLRERLEQYYLQKGRHDGLVILLPKGGYVPQFERKALEIPAQSAKDGDVRRQATKELTSSWGGALDTAAVLRGFLRRSVLEVAPAPSRERHSALQFRLKYLALASVVCAIAGLHAWYFLRLPKAPNASPRLVPLTSYPGVAFAPTISPDGRQLAFVWDGGTGNYDVYLKLIGIGDPIRLTTNLAQNLHPAWSPNGQYLALLRNSPVNRQVVIMPALGGSERELTDLETSPGTWTTEPNEADKRRGPVWSSDGKFLAVTDGDKEGSKEKRGDGIFLVKVSDGSKRRFTAPPASYYDCSPAFSPDGKFLAFVRYVTNSVTDLFIAHLPDGRIRRLTSDRREIEGASWTPDSRSIVFSSNRNGAFCLWRIRLSGDQPELIAAAAANATDPFVARDGKRIAYTDTFENTNVWRMPRNGLNKTGLSAEPFISSSRRNDSAQYSPDGEEIAFVSDRSGSWQIWTCNRNGKNLVQLTSLGGSVTGSPRWSPDGEWLAFDSREEGHSAIYLLPRLGGEPKRIEMNSYEESMPTWSRDGKWLYFTSNRGGGSQLWKRPVAGGLPQRLTTEVGFDAVESPDRQSVYYLSKRPGIWKVSTSGGESTVVPELSTVYPSRYSAVTDSGIYFVAGESAPRAIQFFSFFTRQIETLGNIQRNLVTGTPSLAVSPDDQWILYTQEDRKSSDIMLLENF